MYSCQGHFPVVILIALCSTSIFAKPRHIVFIVGDDLGWNDVGFHNPDMITPNIDRLANKGVILNNSYVQPLCTPSRNSWMSGVYPYKLGMQRGVIITGTNQCSPLDLEFFPQKLQKLGYSTHMAGKWHLGACSWNCTPTYRGFDSFLGYYGGQEDYYTKVLGIGIDFHDGEKPLNDSTYSTYLYAERAISVINNHNQSQPLFLYLPFQSVHIPIEVPKRYENMYPNIKTKQRRQYCGMVSAMDEAIGKVTEALNDTGMIDDTLIIFTSDNGGTPAGSGNNYPLRGAKGTIFEGGTRAASFIVGDGVQKTGYTYDGLMHAVDWHPTMVAAAGGLALMPDNIDGVNQWEAISTGGESSRKEFVYNLDSIEVGSQGHAAIRVGDFKLIQGYPGYYTDWYKPDKIYEESYDHENYEHENDYYSRLASDDLKNKSYLTKQGYNHVGKWPGEGLYNLRDDPAEHIDLSETFPDIVSQLQTKLDEYRKAYVEPKVYEIDPRSFPENFGGFWTPGWC